MLRGEFIFRRIHCSGSRNWYAGHGNKFGGHIDIILCESKSLNENQYTNPALSYGRLRHANETEMNRTKLPTSLVGGWEVERRP